MNETKETNPTADATPEQAAVFMAEILKAVGAQTDRNNKPQPTYANNFHFEPSVWDLKILCGQLEQHTGKSLIDWRSALTIPWIQVKLLAYFLRLQAAWNELQNGPITIPAFVMPPEPKPPSGDLANDPAAAQFYEVQKKIFAEMFGA